MTEEEVVVVFLSSDPLRLPPNKDDRRSSNHSPRLPYDLSPTDLSVTVVCSSESSPARPLTLASPRSALTLAPPPSALTLAPPPLTLAPPRSALTLTPPPLTLAPLRPALALTPPALTSAPRPDLSPAASSVGDASENESKLQPTTIVRNDCLFIVSLRHWARSKGPLPAGKNEERPRRVGYDHRPVVLFPQPQNSLPLFWFVASSPLTGRRDQQKARLTPASLSPGSPRLRWSG